VRWYVLTLKSHELQKLVLMVGSKKALGTYLGMDTKMTDTIWRENNLLTPVAWLRTLARIEQLEMLAKAGSLAKLASKLSCSEAALRPIFIGEPIRELNWELDRLLGNFERYRSVRLVAHMNDVLESLVRKEIERHELELTDLIDYSFGDNSNSKGRRAEVEYLRLRGPKVTEDRNKTNGSQAEFDVLRPDHEGIVGCQGDEGPRPADHLLNHADESGPRTGFDLILRST
jgi:hypothetical protein